MPLPPTHIMSYLQYAYVEAVVAQAGATCTPYPKDYGLDARISEIRVQSDGSHEPSGIGFDCQLKATANMIVSDGNFVYRLDVRTYNILARMKGTLGILIVYNMPKEQGEWLRQNTDMLCLRNCCYWTQIPREPLSDRSKRSKVPIKIPQNQVFDVEAVIRLLSQANRGVGALIRG